MLQRQHVAKVLLFFYFATQGSLVGASTLAQPQSRLIPPQIESPRPSSDTVAEAPEEPPSTPQPTAAPTPIPTPEPTLTPTPMPVSKPIATKKPVPVPISDSSHEELMASAGISSEDFSYVSFIVAHEGNWRPCVQNGGTIDCSYTGNKSYGVCQSKPGSKMASMGEDWQTNPVTQLRWCNSYAMARYGSWKKAYEVWIAQKWW